MHEVSNIIQYLKTPVNVGGRSLWSHTENAACAPCLQAEASSPCLWQICFKRLTHRKAFEYSLSKMADCAYDGWSIKTTQLPRMAGQVLKMANYTSGVACTLRSTAQAEGPSSLTAGSSSQPDLSRDPSITLCLKRTSPVCRGRPCASALPVLRVPPNRVSCTPESTFSCC